MDVASARRDQNRLAGHFAGGSLARPHMTRTGKPSRAVRIGAGISKVEAGASACLRSRANHPLRIDPTAAIWVIRVGVIGGCASVGQFGWLRGTPSAGRGDAEAAFAG